MLTLMIQKLSIVLKCWPSWQKDRKSARLSFILLHGHYPSLLPSPNGIFLRCFLRPGFLQHDLPFGILWASLCCGDLRHSLGSFSRYPLELGTGVRPHPPNMVFESPSWVPKIPFTLPDAIPVGDFILSGNRSLPAEVDVKPPFICALSGELYTTQEVQYRIESLARSLCKELGWTPNTLSPWDKIVGVISLNTVSAHPPYFMY